MWCILIILGACAVPGSAEVPISLKPTGGPAAQSEGTNFVRLDEDIPSLVKHLVLICCLQVRLTATQQMHPSVAA